MPNSTHPGPISTRGGAIEITLAAGVEEAFNEFSFDITGIAAHDIIDFSIGIAIPTITYQFTPPGASFQPEVTATPDDTPATLVASLVPQINAAQNIVTATDTGGGTFRIENTSAPGVAFGWWATTLQGSIITDTAFMGPSTNPTYVMSFGGLAIGHSSGVGPGETVSTLADIWSTASAQLSRPLSAFFSDISVNAPAGRVTMTSNGKGFIFTVGPANIAMVKAIPGIASGTQTVYDLFGRNSHRISLRAYETGGVNPARINYGAAAAAAVGEPLRVDGTIIYDTAPPREAISAFSAAGTTVTFVFGREGD